MGISPTDKSKDFIESGMTLITEVASDKYLKKTEYKIPEDRYSRPCGGAHGFDDYVERWHE